MEYITGRITGVQPGLITIQARYNHTERVVNKCSEVTIGLADGRKASPAQIRKAHTIISAIADYQGEHRIEAEREQKSDFVAQQLGMTDVQATFSLKECDMTTAREFIAFLIDRCVDWGIPLDVPLASLCEDVERYVYSCFMHKSCCVCGKHAELHHVDRVGVGGDRKHMNHIGMRALPLCRIHHQEAHGIGDDAFCAIHHVIPLKINEQISGVYDLGGSKEENG